MGQWGRRSCWRDVWTCYHVDATWTCCTCSHSYEYVIWSPPQISKSRSVHPSAIRSSTNSFWTLRISRFAGQSSKQYLQLPQSISRKTSLHLSWKTPISPVSLYWQVKFGAVAKPINQNIYFASQPEYTFIDWSSGACIERICRDIVLTARCAALDVWGDACISVIYITKTIWARLTPFNTSITKDVSAATNQARHLRRTELEMARCAYSHVSQLRQTNWTLEPKMVAIRLGGTSFYWRGGGDELWGMSDYQSMCFAQLTADHVVVLLLCSFWHFDRF